MILREIDHAVTGGARQEKACELIGISLRTLERWKGQGGGEDLRHGLRATPANKLSARERKKVLQTANSPEFRDLSPKQIVPLLADRKQYLASESTMYRILRAEKQLAHRSKSRVPVKRPRPREHVARGPNEVWSWDITYLKTPLRGQYLYLYMVVDIWSRKIVAAEVFAEECGLNARLLIDSAYRNEGIEPGSLVLHSDNGGPMKGATLKATLDKLGVTASYSRPSVSNDNPFSESLFKTLKYRPEYPSGPFASIDAARLWLARFLRWYNTRHLHSSIRFVTPEDRHQGRDSAILQRRHTVYQAARDRHPERWSQDTRNWTPIEEVRLNPDEIPQHMTA